MAQSVRKELSHGVLWNFAEKILVEGVQFVIGIILARLLLPSDFGLVGMLAIFLAISNVIIDGGFAKALIQKKDCQDIDYSTAFVTNVIMSCAIYLILFFTAPLIAKFYHEPVLTNLTRVLALNFVLGAFNIVQRARLMAKVDFKSLAKIRVASIVVGGIVGVVMAYTGFGVWALVGQNLSNTLVQISLFPFFSKWKLSLNFSKESFKQLFGFGSKLMITGVYSVIINNISTICIGRAYNSNKLGFYTRASQFSQLIAFTVNDVLGTVTFPVLSHLQDEKEHMVAVYRKTLFFTAMIIFPIMILCTLLAKPIVLILLTEKWLPCVVLMQWLFLARMFTPLSSINMNVLNAVGRSDLFMKVDFSKAPLLILMLVITIPIGVEAICIGSFINSFICFFINAYMPGRLFGYGAWQQLKDWRYIFLSILIMSGLVLLFCYFVTNIWLQVIVGGLIGIGSYIGCCYLFGVINQEMIEMIKIRRKKE
ncbi:MAG: lipopolysaccharide biosynthesis protein [Clostridia bacterium]|nr:lipopolysaccharide biosynthesis protein [Clostridia bacterium]